jgi:hypothetical protein
MQSANRKGEPVMRTASVIARYVAGAIFLVFGLNGFLKDDFESWAKAQDWNALLQNA